ncbi:YhcU family protein [Neobacillus sp. OS1-2]|uniref:YhcU family protein n=1 Tax=Neobacillus sp. OS1-2 TaxID=3070680 RepID=UPI0027E21255|nr:YhcU family protein [Neobacillus sp. OS1-2]WML38599.1 YhcU family protein [Neobacillus sp. OS1-2]
MKIVFASTPSQEEEINGLVRYVYSNIFPLYYSDEEICEFKQLKVLRTPEDFNTLKDAFQVMTCIQTIISILESSPLDEQYEAVFDKNVATLQEFGLFFPFEFQQFVDVKRMKNTMLSIFTKADNELII